MLCSQACYPCQACVDPDTWERDPSSCNQGRPNIALSCPASHVSTYTFPPDFPTAQQEELLLSVCMACAICSLLASLTPGNSSDYVYAAYFLICTSTFLKIRWWVGTSVMATPVAVAKLWHRGQAPVLLPSDAMVHIVVAWAVGGLMAYLAEWYRRQMFASQKMAAAAHQKELLEAQARIKAQRQLAAAQAQAAHRALSVAREKASNEAKSEFMSLMCHEVRLVGFVGVGRACRVWAGHGCGMFKVGASGTHYTCLVRLLKYGLVRSGAVAAHPTAPGRG